MTDPERLGISFLGLPPERTALDGADAVVLPIPFEMTTSYGGGTRNGPAAILAASPQVELFDHEMELDLAEARIHTAPALAPDLSAPGAMVEIIAREAARLGEGGRWVVGLGGEHTVTAGLVRAAAEKAGRPLAVLQLDAHLDLRATWDRTPWSHACVMRRILEEGHRTAHVGIRNAAREELDLVRERDLPVFWARSCHTSRGWIDDAVDSLDGPVYLSLDVDGLDPAVIRGTGTPEPGGLGWWQVMDLLDCLFDRKEVVAADVVELAAPGDVAGEFAAARLVAKLIALHLAHR